MCIKSSNVLFISAGDMCISCGYNPTTYTQTFIHVFACRYVYKWTCVHVLVVVVVEAYLLRHSLHRRLIIFTCRRDIQFNCCFLLEFLAKSVFRLNPLVHTHSNFTKVNQPTNQPASERRQAACVGQKKMRRLSRVSAAQQDSKVVCVHSLQKLAYEVKFVSVCLCVCGYCCGLDRFHFNPYVPVCIYTIVFYLLYLTFAFCFFFCKLCMFHTQDTYA